MGTFESSVIAAQKPSVSNVNDKWRGFVNNLTMLGIQFRQIPRPVDEMGTRGMVYLAAEGVRTVIMPAEDSELLFH